MAIEVAKNIRRIRQEKGLLMRQLAAKMQLPESYVSDIERGKFEPKAERVLEFATALEVTPNDLYGIVEREAAVVAAEAVGD